MVFSSSFFSHDLIFIYKYQKNKKPLCWEGHLIKFLLFYSLGANGAFDDKGSPDLEENMSVLFIK
jgi:hypothetical protein